MLDHLLCLPLLSHLPTEWPELLLPSGPTRSGQKDLLVTYEQARILRTFFFFPVVSDLILPINLNAAFIYFSPTNVTFSRQKLLFRQMPSVVRDTDKRIFELCKVRNPPRRPLMMSEWAGWLASVLVDWPVSWLIIDWPVSWLINPGQWACWLTSVLVN